MKNLMKTIVVTLMLGKSGLNQMANVSEMGVEINN